MKWKLSDTLMLAGGAAMIAAAWLVPAIGLAMFGLAATIGGLVVEIVRRRAAR